MSRTCCVDGCDATSDNNFVFFSFPIKPALLREWRAVVPCSRLSSDSKVCSRHFNKTDYDIIRGKVRLKAKVVPSIFEQATNSPTTSESEDSNSKTNGETKQKPVKKTRKPKKNKRNCNKPDQSETENEIGINDVQRESETKDADVCFDENGHEKYTIECVPESVLPADTDSEPDMQKGDIEDIIANYHIRQDIRLPVDTAPPPIPAPPPPPPPPLLPPPPPSTPKPTQADTQSLAPIEVAESPPAPDPIFVEIAVGKGNADTGADCMMVMESVQVDLDPATFLLDPPTNTTQTHNKQDPISLLTSSDEDDVIIQEPHVDTVEVSDEDEDDQPLMKLVKGSPTDLTTIVWDRLYSHYCLRCGFACASRADLAAHTLKHSTVLQCCPYCEFTTPSKGQLERHKKLHRDQKKHKCHLCDYKAKHRMSLVYHMKAHDNGEAKSHAKTCKKFQCNKCKFSAKSSSGVLRHLKTCKLPYSCEMCSYVTKRRSDMKRHCARKHRNSGDGEQEFD